MNNLSLRNILRREIGLNEQKNAVGKIPSIGLTIHNDATYDSETKQLTLTVSNQSTKAPQYVIPDVESEDKVQEIVSGLESELGAAIRSFSKSLDKILDKYQQ